MTRPPTIPPTSLTGMLPEQDDWDAVVRRCRVCGCTDERACPGGCQWAATDLCTTCAGQED